MGFLARLFGMEPQPKRPFAVKWQEHPFTKTLAWRLAHGLRHAKELKLKRERVGRSADYWQGQVDAFTVILNCTRGYGLWEDGLIGCYRERCVTCGADEDSPCDEEKHKQDKNDPVV